MKMKECPECDGERRLFIKWDEGFWSEETPPAGAPIPCPTCEGTGTDEPVNHCAACGEPIKFGDRWCEQHQLATLFEPLEPPGISDSLVELVDAEKCDACEGTGERPTPMWHPETNPDAPWEECPYCGGSGYV
ncbi:hypothetical protein H6F43_03405 [Leptolyngbya sp. FACHB-36]|uniref:hypothetical protein n=1 Tax=Leptolyngbya sp. FACHB-36 TaxID=2692808 RepID=UPI001680F2F8|nr:hypothetical protein [Leptolyngbya sp. FACHB-36]MBD2019228.1 hypothetical protein [Leptolyngbya sp. FACHB-36]